MARVNKTRLDELLDEIVAALGEPPAHARAVARRTIMLARSDEFAVVAVPQRPRRRQDVKIDGPDVLTPVEAFWAAREAWALMRLFSDKAPTLTEGGRFHTITRCFLEAITGDPDRDVTRACRRVFHARKK